MFLRQLAVLVLVAVTLATTTTVSAAVQLTAPLSVPTSGEVSLPLDGSFLSYSVEPAFYELFFGNYSQPNQFTFKLLQHLTDRTGNRAPIIRPGGNTMDSANYDYYNKQTITRVTAPNGLIWRTTYGPNYYRSFQSNFPSSYKFVVTLDFKNNSLPAATRAAVAAVDYAGSRIKYFELGNEVSAHRVAF